MEAAAAAAYIVQAVQAVVVCLEMPPVQELDLSRLMLITQEAVCFHQAA